jgi:hypothetical protein
MSEFNQEVPERNFLIYNLILKEATTTTIKISFNILLFFSFV